MRTTWSVAYRTKENGSILTDTDTPFIKIKNTLRFWAADPFVFEENGSTYLFAELYDHIKLRGTLGYCKFDGKKFTKWKSVITEDHHLSFPNIFKLENEIYIMPEAHQSNSLYLYRATDFPDKWEKCRVLYDGKKLVDTVLLNENGRSYFFTYEINYPEKNLLYIAQMDESGKADAKTMAVISDDDGSARPGGNFIKYKGETVRVSQDCAEKYGDGLVFSKVISIDKSEYREEKIKRIGKNDIKISDGTPVYGTHTYNANGKFEVIDIKTKQSNLSYILSIPFKLRKKLFGRSKKHG